MIVVADTTPLRYLVVIECAHLLPFLYDRVLIPPAVAEELNHPSTPEEVRAWLAAKPPWLDVRIPRHSLDANLGIDLGEREAIALAQEVRADAVLVDDWEARLEAERQELRVVGTLRVLTDGAVLGLVDLNVAFGRLRRTNFRADSQLIDTLLEESRRRTTG